MFTLKILFWLFLAIVFYTYVGYYFVLRLLLCLRDMRHGRESIAALAEEDLPDVTLLICAYNEEVVVHGKMQNCNALVYPPGRLHIVWVTDGSNDSTNSLLRQYDNVEVLYQPERRGKTAALNRAIPLISTPIIVFTDANTILNPEAIRRIVEAFADERVGCVSGEKRVLANSGDGLAAQGEGAYWRYESTLKALDSRLYSTMGAAGELFAIRRELFSPIDINVLLDDFIMSMNIVGQGYTIRYQPQAYACETGSANLAEEKKRKVRIAAGGLQSIWLLRRLMNPFRHGIVSFQLISHRFLRWSLAPVMLFALLPINAVLAVAGQGGVYAVALACQAIFYLMALCRLKVPLYFTFMNLNVFLGAVYLMRKKKGTGAWEKARRL